MQAAPPRKEMNRMQEKISDSRRALMEPLTFLDPGKIKILRTSCGFVDAEIDGQHYKELKVARMFPVSLPDAYITVSDSSGKELGIILDLAKFEKSQSAVLEQALDHAYFMPKIRKVYSVTERFHVVSWDVMTDRGRRRFEMTVSTDQIIHLGPDRLVLHDIDHNRYEIESISALDPESRTTIDPHI